MQQIIRTNRYGSSDGLVEQPNFSGVLQEPPDFPRTSLPTKNQLRLGRYEPVWGRYQYSGKRSAFLVFPFKVSIRSKLSIFISMNTIKSPSKNAVRDFPVVCVGGSAGGLEAYMRLLKNLPSNMGAAIVIVNHLRTVATRLHEILPLYTEMPVKLIGERMVIRPDHVYIIPEKRDLHVEDDEFRLKPISKPSGWPDVITVFLCSLAKHWKGKLIAVIVSGYDGDGSEALCAIQEAGELPSRKGPIPPSARICPLVQSKAGASILCHRPKKSPKQSPELPLCPPRTFRWPMEGRLWPTIAKP